MRGNREGRAKTFLSLRIYTRGLKHMGIMWPVRAFCAADQWRRQPKDLVGARNFGGGPKCLILGEWHYFVWKNASQSTKWLCFLKIFGGHGASGPPWLRLLPILFKSLTRTEHFYSESRRNTSLGSVMAMIKLFMVLNINSLLWGKVIMTQFSKLEQWRLSVTFQQL